MNYTTHQDQLAKIELLLDNDTYKRYNISMSRLDRLQLIENITNGRA